MDFSKLSLQKSFPKSDSSLKPSQEFIGNQAGYNGQGANAIALGQNAGNGATIANYSNFIGESAGRSAINANNSKFFGQNAGYSATSANN